MFVIDFVFRVTIQACFGDYNFWVVWMSTRCSINTNCTFYSFNKLNIHVARIDQNHVHPTYDDWSWVIVNYKGVCSATEVYGSILCGFNFFSGVLISVHILLIRKKKNNNTRFGSTLSSISVLRREARIVECGSSASNLKRKIEFFSKRYARVLFYARSNKQR